MKISTHINWRHLFGEFVVVVAGVLVALWVDQIREDHVDAGLEVEYLRSLIVDLDADLAQYDTTETWMRGQETAAATVLALYKGSPAPGSAADLVKSVETAGWQFFPSITRNTMDDLKSTGHIRLITDPAIRRAIASYYATVENSSIPMAAMRDRMWAEYDARVANVLEPGVRLGVLQRDQSFGLGITSNALSAAPAPDSEKLIAALKAYPALETAAGEVLYQTIANRATVGSMRRAALELKATLQRWLAAHGKNRKPGS